MLNGDNNYEIITVATHNEGMLNELLDNSFNQNVKVLGFGQKWRGFKMKYELIYEYIKNKSDDDIIIFIDGFDSIINGKTDDAVKIFKKNNYKMLFSKNNPISFLDRKIFNECIGDIIANTGMWMGYVKYSKILLKELIKDKCNDDQRVLNNHCKSFDFIQIDTNEEIFYNRDRYDKNTNKNYKPIFISYPATFSINRFYRSIFEYGQFLLSYILILFIFVMVYLYYKNNHYTIVICMILFIVYLFNIDTSCI